MLCLKTRGIVLESSINVSGKKFFFRTVQFELYRHNGKGKRCPEVDVPLCPDALQHLFLRWSVTYWRLGRTLGWIMCEPHCSSSQKKVYVNLGLSLCSLSHVLYAGCKCCLIWLPGTGRSTINSGIGVGLQVLLTRTALKLCPPRVLVLAKQNLLVFTSQTAKAPLIHTKCWQKDPRNVTVCSQQSATALSFWTLTLLFFMSHYATYIPKCWNTITVTCDCQ